MKLTFEPHFEVSKELSEKIRILSFICTIMVMYRHSLNFYAFFGTSQLAGYSASIQSLFWSITEVAVPFFFIVSGLFFLHNNHYKIPSFLCTLKKKVHTLFIPFLFWNIISIPLFLVVNRDTFSVTSFLQSLLRSDFYGPLWYVRDVLVLILCTPLYYWILRIDSKLAHIALVIGLFIYWNPFELEFLTSVSVSMFLLGGVFCRYLYILSKNLSNYWLIFLPMVWIVLQILPNYDIQLPYRYNMQICIGLVIMWNSYRFIPDRYKNKLLSLSKYSFFVYVTHYYVEKFIKKILGVLFWENEAISLITYLLLPIVTCAMLVALAKVLNNKFPVFYKFVTGGR